MGLIKPGPRSSLQELEQRKRINQRFDEIREKHLERARRRKEARLRRLAKDP